MKFFKVKELIRIKLRLPRPKHAEAAKAQSTQSGGKRSTKVPNDGPREGIEEQSVEVVETESIGVPGQPLADFGRFQTAYVPRSSVSLQMQISLSY